jgi:hypothetical protein
MDFNYNLAETAHQDVYNRHSSLFAKSVRIILENIDDFHNYSDKNDPHREGFIQDFLNKNRTKLPQFIEKSNQVIPFLSKLKNSIFNIIHDRWRGTYFPESYYDIIDSFNFFFERYRYGFEHFYEYVQWLNDKWADKSPALLYTKHSSWADTDRRLRFDDAISFRKFAKNKTNNEIHQCILLSFIGFFEWNGQNLVWEIMYTRILSNIKDYQTNNDNEDITQNKEMLKYLLEVRHLQSDEDFQNNFVILFLTYNKILNTFRQTIQYFRDAIVRLKGMAETILRQYRYIQDNDFIKWMINNVLTSEINETNYFDLKENIPWWSDRLNNSKEKDKKIKFVEHITSFANSKGGMIIIGVNDAFELIGLKYNERQLEEKVNQFQSDIEHITGLKFALEISSWIKIIDCGESDNIVKIIVILIPQTNYYIAVNGDYFIRGSSGKIKINDPSKIQVEHRSLHKGTNFEWLETYYKMFISFN